MGKGTDYERKLVNKLDGHGWEIVRAGGSGSGTSGARPDLVAGDGDRLWIGEAKFKSVRNIYVEPEEVEQIITVAEAFGGIPVLWPRWNTADVDAVDTADWFVVNPYLLPRTGEGRYALNCDDVTERFPALDEVI